ncbi:MAG TPA: DUF3822 family protein [Pelobium sp.]|nr:DUF3822 family protein [Pelobium sp.]
MTEKIQLTVADFDATQAKTYELYLEIGSNHFNYAVIDPQNQAVKTISHKPSNIYNGIYDDLLKSHFAKTKISLTTQKFTFVPTELFHESATENFIKYIGATDNEEICTQVLTNAGITIIYALPKLQLDKIGSYFPNAEIYPQISPFYKGVNYGFSQISTSQLFINFRDGLAEVIIFNQNQFQFYNIFEFQNEEELLYFVLLSAQENNIKPASATLKLSGFIDPESELYKQLAKYFPHTEVTDQDSLPLFYHGLETPVMPMFFSLLALHLCEL